MGQMMSDRIVTMNRHSATRRAARLLRELEAFENALRAGTKRRSDPWYRDALAPVENTKRGLQAASETLARK